MQGWERDIPQRFSVQVLLDKVNGTDDGYRQIQLALDESQVSFSRKNIVEPPWTMVSAQALAVDPYAYNVSKSAAGCQPYGDWIHISQSVVVNTTAFSYSQSTNGSFPAQLKVGYVPV